MVIIGFFSNGSSEKRTQLSPSRISFCIPKTISSFRVIFPWRGSTVVPRGMRNFFCRHRWRNLTEPEVPRPPPLPPFHHEKTLFWGVGAKKSNIIAKIPKIGAKYPSTKYGAKFKYQGQYSHEIKLCTTKDLPLCTRKFPDPTDLTPPLPFIGVSEKLKCIPLV